MRHAFLVSVTFLTASGLLSCRPEPEQKAALQPASAPLASPLTQRGGPFQQQWAMDKLWEDGKAEVATYAAERMIYGEARQFEYTLITVKEEFNQEFNVKTDDYTRKDKFPVIKVNQFCSIPTDKYPYHFLTSLFFRRDQPIQLHKLTSSSQEWCGNTFKAVSDNGLQYQQSYSSYWDGQGTGQRQLRRDALFEDALPYTLRTLRFAQKPAFSTPIYELQQTNQAAVPRLYKAQIRTEDAQTADTPQPAWRVVVVLDEKKQNTYWFAKEYPNLLLRQATWDGRSLLLKQVSRYAYWPQNPPATATSADTAMATDPAS